MRLASRKAAGLYTRKQFKLTGHETYPIQHPSHRFCLKDCHTGFDAPPAGLDASRIQKGRRPLHKKAVQTHWSRDLSNPAPITQILFKRLSHRIRCASCWIGCVSHPERPQAFTQESSSNSLVTRPIQSSTGNRQLVTRKFHWTRDVSNPALANVNL